MSDFAIHRTKGIFGEMAAIVSRTRATLAPAAPVLCILDRINSLAKFVVEK
jgi:hypothetical protein